MTDTGVVHPIRAAAADTAEHSNRLRRLVVRGSVIEIIGYLLSQGLRLATNLILSRLLFPAAYGLTAIVTVFMVALGMLTDVGLKDSIISSEHGDDLDFLNTAWTIQVIRGFMLWGAAIALAYPVSLLYHEPRLFAMITVASFALVIHGFGSTKLDTLARHVRRGPLLVVEVTSKVAAMIVMFVWAKLSPTVWALIAGGMTQSVLEVVGSHLLPTGYVNRFRWDKTAARTITNFGKWIFGSSLFTFLAGEGDRILLGRFLTMATLGVYSVAGMLGSAVGQVVNRLTYAVFFGLFSQVVRERPAEVGRHYYAARLKLDLLAMPALGALVVLGPNVVRLLYDPRYRAAGYMLQFLCVRVGLQCILYPCGVCIIALGHPRFHLIANAGRFIAVWIGIPLGWYLGHLKGVLWGTTVSELPMLVVFWFAFRRFGLLRISRELIAPVAAGVGAALGLVLKIGLDRYLPNVHLHH